MTFLSYVTYGVMVGSCYLSEASGIEKEYWAAINDNDTIRHYDNCADREVPCEFGSSNDQQVSVVVAADLFIVDCCCCCFC